jgi:hypothetical protein
MYDEWWEEFQEFVEGKEFLKKDDGDPDPYRAGYRCGYYDALRYVQEWFEESVVENQGGASEEERTG